MKTIFKKALILLCLIFYIGNNGYSQIIYINHSWLIYDIQSKQLYPFVKKNKENLPLHIALDKMEYKGLYLHVKSSEDVALYVNNKYFQFYDKGSHHYIPIDSINNEKKGSLLSFYGKYNSSLIDSLSICYSMSTSKGLVHSKLENTIKRNYRKSYFALLLLASGAIFVFFRSNYTKAFDQYFNFNDLFLNFKIEPAQTRSNFEGYYFAFVLIGSVFFALACSGLPILNTNYVDIGFGKYFLNVFNLIITAWFFYFLKYLMIQVISWMFSVSKFATLHFKVFIRISLMWSTALILVNLGGQTELCSFSLFLFQAFLLVSLFFLTLISFKVSLLINQVNRISTLYLISYLCLTEWLPYFIILKLYLVYFY